MPHRRAILEPKLGKGDQGVSAYWKMLFPLFLAVVFEQTQLYVDRALATGLPAGALSAQGYALRLIRMSSELWLTSFGTVVFPVFASLAASAKQEEFSRNFSLALQAAMLFFIFSGATLISQAGPFVRLLLERGAFRAEDTVLTAHLLNYYTVAYMAQAVWIIVLRGFHAFGDTKTPVYLTCFSMLVTIALDFILVRTMGISGLALALAVGYSLNMILSYVFFSKRILSHHTLENLKTVIIGLSAVLGLMVHRCWSYWEAQQMMQGLVLGLIGLVVLTAAAGILFAATLRLLRVPALEYLLQKLKQWRKKNEINLDSTPPQ
jgi:putative peptidoglycan lipid II flippase